MNDARSSSVFVNCPFDTSFRALFDGIVFALKFCGFTVRSALEVSDSGEPRLVKIMRLIEQSRFSIHDISRVELDAATNLPRFNMPIELGIALGMKHLGRAGLRDHLLLVLDTERYRYQTFASDLAGVDIAPHGNKLDAMVTEVRGFVAPHATKRLPGAATIVAAYTTFLADLPKIAEAERQNLDELTYTDRLQHLDTFLGSLA